MLLFFISNLSNIKEVINVLATVEEVLVSFLSNYLVFTVCVIILICSVRNGHNDLKAFASKWTYNEFKDVKNILYKGILWMILSVIMGLSLGEDLTNFLKVMASRLTITQNLSQFTIQRCFAGLIAVIWIFFALDLLIPIWNKKRKY